MGKYRSKLQIVADMLFVVRGNYANKTRIMYQANLSYKLLCRYLEDVVNAGLISFEKGNSYVLTSKGVEFLKRFEEHQKQCQLFEEQNSSIQGERAELEKMLFNEGRAPASLLSKILKKKASK
jgi:predicted transcriptional regulator